MTTQDAVSLTKSLLRFDTVNPPGRERDCARYAGAMLQEWGFKVEYLEYADSRTSVVARAGGSDRKAPLCLTGHLDVVPLGARAWTKDPFNGDTDGDKLYGRGASDMKAGVAAILLAARSFSKKADGHPGSRHRADRRRRGRLRRLALSSRRRSCSARPARWSWASRPRTIRWSATRARSSSTRAFKGVSAHGSMPELGVNAIYKAGKALASLEGFDFATPEHPVMGKPTLNVGTIEGGNTVNAVPDAAQHRRGHPHRARHGPRSPAEQAAGPRFPRPSSTCSPT